MKKGPWRAVSDILAHFEKEITDLKKRAASSSNDPKSLLALAHSNEIELRAVKRDISKLRSNVNAQAKLILELETRLSSRG